MKSSKYLQIERAAFASWPAFEQVARKGWIFRYAEGCTKRANSVQVIEPLKGDLAKAIAFTDSHYAEWALSTVFRLLSFVDNEALDAHLADLEYRFVEPSLVLGMELKGSGPKAAAAASIDRDEWLAIYCAISGKNLSDQLVHRKILQKIPEASLFAVHYEDGRAVACGVGVLDDGCLGIFDIVTESELRNRGHAANLIARMLVWARLQAASFAYVQVLAANAPAVRLYEKLGYRRLYDYWYRVKTRSISQVPNNPSNPIKS